MVEFMTEYEARRACEDGVDAAAAQGTDRWFEAYGATADRLKDKRRLGGLLHSSLRSLVLNKVATRKGRVDVEPMMLGEARRACEAAADASAAPGADDWFEAYGANAERLRDKWQVEPTVHHDLLSLARKRIATRDGQVVVPGRGTLRFGLARHRATYSVDATRARMPVPDKLMPDPWFVSTSSPRGIGDALHREPYRRADVAKGERMVGPFVLPSYQRGKAWTVEQQVGLVESLWEGLPIGGYVYNDDQSFGGDAPCPLAYLLDGQQRWTAIFDYVADAFPVKGHLYSELGQRERFRFQMKEFTMFRCNLKTEEECRHVYERLAYGGTPHLSLDKDYVVEGRSYRLVEAEPEYEGGAPSV